MLVFSEKIELLAISFVCSLWGMKGLDVSKLYTVTKLEIS